MNIPITKHRHESSNDIEFVKEQHLIKTLTDLKIGDTAESDEDDEKEDNDNDDDIHDEISNRCWSFLSQKPTASSDTQTKPETQNAAGKTVQKMDTNTIGDTAESDEDDEKEDSGNDDDIHDEISNRCWSFLSQKPTASSDTQTKPETQNAVGETVEKMDTNTNISQSKPLSDDEKLARIRSKYSRTKICRPPVMIEAKPLIPDRGNKLPDKFYENVQKLFSEWCGSETIRFLRCGGKTDSSPRVTRITTETERMVAQFYAGDRPIGESREEVFLPLVDSVDQAKQRISVLDEMLKPR
ncbi:unnamed protein product [Gongylonema pulchrum]|uniref:Uncharacterized protein n=1 Tax=Gongylonema pulchrum TaxID=637853 RepID=A0A3P7M840_9BILA|nr:unnamed protein product [Gongylonema pulchrum]